MGDASFVQASFLGGEWSQFAQGRMDDKEYRSAMSVCRNGYPIEQGGWVRRPGTKHASTTRSGQAARLIPFDFQENNPYVMEYTDSFLRFRNGPDFVTTNDDQVIVSVSTANPPVVTTTTDHGWTTGDTVIFTGLGNYCIVLQNRQLLITVLSATTFSLQDALTGVDLTNDNINSPPAGATVKRIREIATPYGAGVWESVRSVQAETTAVLLNKAVKPQVLVATPAVNDDFATFALTPSNFKDGPYLDPVKGGAIITPSGISGIVDMVVTFPAYDSTTVYNTGDFVASSSVNYQSIIDQNLNLTPASNPTAWKAVSAGIAVGPNGFTGNDIGRSIRLFSEPPLWATGTSYSAGNVVKFNGSYWTALTSMTGATPTAGNINPNQPGNLLTTWAVNASAKRWTWGKITALSNQIPQTQPGTVFGDMTSGGGNAAAFDGNTSQNTASGAQKVDSFGVDNTIYSYVGKHFTTHQKIAYATIFPSNDSGFVRASLIPVTLELRAKNGSAPSGAGDGTLLGSLVGIPNSFLPVTITSNDQTTQWDYVWVTVQDGRAITGVHNAYIAEVQMYNPTGTGGGTGVKVEILGDPLLYTSAITTWRLGLYSDTTGWPTCGTYHEGRLWLAGVIGNRVDSSKSNDLFNFAPTAADGTVADSNGISAVFDAPDVNAIFWMLSDHLGIIVGTQAGEWLVQASALNSPLTPTSMQAHRYTNNGCANIEPRRTGQTLLFVQKFKRKIMEYFADVFSGRFTSPDLTVKAKHISEPGIAELAFQQEISPIVWARLEDGNFAGCSYKRENLMSSQGPTYSGWHGHTLGTGRVVESICVGPSVDGNLDTLTMVTNDPDTNVRHVELLTQTFQESMTITDAWFLDNGIVPSFRANVVIGGVSYYELGGLWNLNGKVVTAYIGGLDCGSYTVTNSVINVPFMSDPDGLLTQDYIATFTDGVPIVVGAPYVSQGQITRPAFKEETGARNGPGFGKTKRTHLLALLLSNTRKLRVGTQFVSTYMYDCKLTTAGGTPLGPLDLFSGIWRDTLQDSYTYDSQPCWEASGPFPASVLALGGFLQTQDK